MKNSALVRRLILGSMILGLNVPGIYHVALNIIRYNHFNRLAEQVCKAIEPRIQVGAQREALEFLKSSVSNQSMDAYPEIEFKDHGVLISPPIKKVSSLAHESCEFQGITGVDVKIYYQQPSILNVSYIYIYLASVPILSFLLLLVRRGVLSFQRKVADLIERQMKQLFDMGSIPEPEKASLFFKLFDLEIPLLKYLKGHIDNLEMDLNRYSQEIAEKQKREVLMDVAAQMAHDIVTPISNLQTILASDEKKNNEELISSELGQIKHLSEKLLREYRGEIVLAPTTSYVIDVVSCVKTAVESIKIFARDIRPVEFQIQYDSNFSPHLKGDRAEFIVALSNILRNSVEASDRELGQITIKIFADDKEFQILISDNGCGIKKEDLSRVFENKVSIGKANGTGIGLYQVRSTIERMNGTVNMESTVGSGTTLKLSWPISEIIIEKPVAENRREISAADSKPDLVFIDDSKASRTSWSIQAKREQKNLLTFSSWQEFKANSDEIDKAVPIFVDYTFADSAISGKEVAEKIVADGFQNLFITTGLPPEYVDKPLGVKAVLNKDFPRAEFI